jgi:hypothetical protein
MRFSSKEELFEYAKIKGGQAKSLGADAVKWVTSGAKVVSGCNLSSRLEICHSCDFWDQSGFGGTGSCKKCGCSTYTKLRMATSKCPIDKWGQVDVVKTD